MKKLKKAFYIQKWHAINLRNIAFHLTFDEWLQIWLDSSHLEERGCRKGQYCMSRYGDTGPYAIGNVFIQTSSGNVGDAQKEKPSPLKGQPKSEEHKKKMSAALKGKPRSEETKKKISAALKGIPKRTKGN